MYRIGIDVGGTFTDFTLLDERDGSVRFHKVTSTPTDPSEAIATGIADLLALHSIRADKVSHIGHGTTVATNLIIERKGARTGLITTRGFRDVLEIGRQTRPHLYDYRVTKPPPLALREHRIEVAERVNAAGDILVPLDTGQVARAAAELEAAGVRAIAICFLHSYKRPEHEQRARQIVEALMPRAYISVSSEVLPEFREYERMSTTVLNAAVGPRMQRYLDRFLERVRELGIETEPFTVHSNGGLMSVQAVRSFPVRTCLSGPAAGVVGAAAVGHAAGLSNLVTFDVGGTSTDVSLVWNGKPLFSSSRTVADYPVKTPMIDIHVIGAGGGSIACRDDAGGLKVGPRSAGAVPGPAAYGKGGVEPTITDALVCLHRLNPVSLLGGRLPVHEAAARHTIMERIARPFGLMLEAAAEGVIRIANANMSRAIRSVSTERGYDLREFALFAYGGAGPLHAADIAAEIGIPRVVVPQEPGTMCARGMLLTDVTFDFVRSSVQELTAGSWQHVRELFSDMEREADAWLARERVPADERGFRSHVDARYEGQNFEVHVPIESLATLDMTQFVSAFHRAHRQEYGYELPERAIEIVNCRMQAIGRVPTAPLQKLAPRGSLRDARLGERSVYHGGEHGWIDTVVYARSALGSGVTMSGPAIIEEMSSTTLLNPGQSLRVDDIGNLVISIGG